MSFSNQSLITFLSLIFSFQLGFAETWVEIGADAEALYFIDTDSIQWEKESIRVAKKAVYSKVMTEELGGAKRVFKQTLGIIEIDCKLRINRVVQIDMLDENGVSIWSSGYMRTRPWEKVLKNTHAERTIDYVCSDQSAT